MKVKEESGENFKSIFDNALDGILIVNPSTKKFLMGNRMICGMLGYDIGEIANISIGDIHLENEMARIIEMFEKQAITEIQLVKDIHVKRKDGSTFSADIYSYPIILDGTGYCSYICRDLTDRKKIEEALCESEKRLSQSPPVRNRGHVP
jgi:PAS domain S-box-containing protein